MADEQKNSLLIVDDELGNLELLTHILGANYTIYTATNGLNAIEKAIKFSPDLIILDILMPQMDGYQTLAEIKKDEKTQMIPVIFLTGLSSSADEARGLSLNAADYISKPFSASIVKLRVRNQLQIVNQMRAIERLSMIDQLTEIPNRRSFDERINIEWNQAIRECRPISLLMMDVDRFKIYNDTYGHQQGDAALKAVAKIITQSLRRASDFSARWGGEEFAVLLQNTPLPGVLDVAQKINVNVENAVIPCADGSETKITISIGLNTLVPMRGSSVENFIANADKALYAAKEQGRNRVVVYS
jgi:diguanylate cyclase (GGDEF)-like protein